MDKLTITRGAVFDYEEIVCHFPLDVAEMRRSVESMLKKEGSDAEQLRLTYRDETAKKDLLLFLRKGYRFGIMQMWILEGICEPKDYEPEMEEDGRIKKWLEVEIE